jgi:hypothetical protein
MSNVEDLQTEIEKLHPTEVERLAEWLDEYKAQAWDNQIAEDAQPGGRLRLLIDQAKLNFCAGKTHRLP